MIIKGVVLKYARDNINTDEIIPARYLNTSDPDELAAHCMEDLDATFAENITGPTILVAGRNFGCGSSREHAPLAIKNAGIKAVVAPNFARIFFRNAINIGLPIFECEAVAQIDAGDKLILKPGEGLIENETQGASYSIPRLPAFLQELIETGGLVNYARAALESQQA